MAQERWSIKAFDARCSAMVPASVFLSFSSHDAALAIALWEGLQSRDIDVWKAPESILPGVDWASAIHAGIQQQHVFLLLWSDAAMAQEISSGHWLEPLIPLMPTTVTSALLAIAAWWTARRDLDHRKLALALGLAAILYILLAMQLAVGLRRLLPLALPLSAAAAMVGVQRCKRIRS
jgi:hypothetical protein